MIERDAEDLLTHWGRWSVQGAGVPGCHAPGNQPVIIITDDEALAVDRCVAALGRRYPVSAECVRIYYCKDRTMQEVGRMLGIPRLKVRELLISAKTYVEACMDMRSAA